MISQDSQQESTQAEIYIEDWIGDTISLKREFKNTIAFSYSNDVLQLGDPFAFSIPDPRGKYADRFQVGSRVKLYLSNPAVAGGASTLKHTGVLVARRSVGERNSGTILHIQCADLGWHLQNNDAPLWKNLRKGTLKQFVEDPQVILPEWGFSGVQLENISAKQKRLNNGLRDVHYVLNQQAIQPLHYIQVEPGDKIADLIFQYARRLNLLVNVGPDGHIILWNPSYTQEPLYRFELHPHGTPECALNNVESWQISEDMTGIYTDVTCVGERVSFEFDDPNNPNASKLRGRFRATPPRARILPFVHRMIFADPEMFQRGLAQKHAEWTWKRALFDSFGIEYTVKGHWQKGMGDGVGRWFEADTMAVVHDTVNGLNGVFYVQSVRCDRSDRAGDTTVLLLRRPGLLSAAFGELPNAPTIKYSTKKESGTTQQNGTTTTVTETR